MIFPQKRHPKLFWVEGLVYLIIIAVCMLGSFGVFDAKAQEGGGLLDTCEEWVKIPATVRLQVLRYGITAELNKTELNEGTQSLSDCLGEYNNMQNLDKFIMAECRRGGEANLAGVFERGLEKSVFGCLKWVNGEEQ